MCLWLLTACLGLLPTNLSPPAQIVIVPGLPTPILQPTTAATIAVTSATTTTTTTPRTTVSPTPTPTTASTARPITVPTTASTARPITVPTTASTAAPITVPTTASTARPITVPTTASTAAPITVPTTASTARPITVPTTASPTTAPTTISTISGNNSMPTENIISSSPTTTASLTTITASNSSSSNTTPMPTAATTNTATPNGVFLSVLLCYNPDVICIFNPDENAAGSLLIDPRLGTTPSGALQGPSIIGYNGQISSVNSAVRFPRERRSINYNNVDISFKDFFNNIIDFFNNNLVFRSDKPKHKILKRQSCQCVPTGTCIRTTSGAGMIDFRIVTPVNVCPAGQENCCGGTTTATIACGTLQTAPSPGVTPGAGQASFGRYPWQALILTKQNDYIAGGVLIDQLNIITVTHRMTPYVVSGTAPNVKVRLGEWDAAATYEPVPFKEYNVTKVFTHPSYNANTLQYDIMVLRLSPAVPFTPAAGSTTTINRACLPPAATSNYTGQRCWVSGWGKNMFGLQGQYQQILKEVDVPIVASATCQTQLRTARLGATFVLDTTSFICAGGESSKDSCTGDGGSGLYCSVNGQWVVVGLVSWGLGCAAANVPAAYVNVAALLPWIQQQVATA